MTCNDSQAIEKVVDRDGVVVVWGWLWPEAVLQAQVVPQPEHGFQQLRRDVHNSLSGGYGKCFCPEYEKSFYTEKWDSQKHSLIVNRTKERTKGRKNERKKK